MQKYRIGPRRPSHTWTPNAAREEEMQQGKRQVPPARKERQSRATVVREEREDRATKAREERLLEILEGLKPYHEVALKSLRSVTRKHVARVNTGEFIETCEELLAVKIPGQFAMKLYRALMAGQRKIGKTTADFSLTRRILLAQHHTWARGKRKADEEAEKDYEPNRSM